MIAPRCRGANGAESVLIRSRSLRAREAGEELSQTSATRCPGRAQAGTPGQTLLLCAIDAKDSVPVFTRSKCTPTRNAVERTTVKDWPRPCARHTLSIVRQMRRSCARDAWEGADPPRVPAVSSLTRSRSYACDWICPGGHERVALSRRRCAGWRPSGPV